MEKETVLNELRDGFFERVSLDEWFSHQEFDYIFATLDGLEKEGKEKTVDPMLLKLISLYAMRYIANPGIDKYNIFKLRDTVRKFAIYSGDLNLSDKSAMIEHLNAIIRDYGEQILRKVIAVASKNIIDYAEAVSVLKDCPIEVVRLEYRSMIEGALVKGNEGPVIASYLQKRDNFIVKWMSLPEGSDERKRINFMAAAIRTGAINTHVNPLKHAKNVAKVTFSSSLFQESLMIETFDKDLLYPLRDCRLLGDTILSYIKEGKILLHEEFVPEYMRNISKSTSDDSAINL